MATEAWAVKPPSENLYRGNNAEGAIELRAATNNDRPVMRGHAAVFDTWTEINSAFEGRFLERLAPGAFSKTISENRDRIRVLFQHGRDPQVGDKPLGPLSVLEEDSTGLRYEVPLLPTSYNADLEPGLRAGLYGASFRFSTVREEYVSRPARSDMNPTGLPERTLQEVRLMELGPVTFGAYPEATSGVRSMTDEFLAAQLFENEALVERLAEQLAKKTRTFSVSFNGTKVTNAEPAERADAEAVALLNQMTDLGQQFLDLETDDPEDTADRETMNEILAQITALTDEEQAEPDDGDGTSSDDGRAKTPEPSEATTSTEPEPPEATTRSQDDQAFKFLFVKPPKHLRSN